MDKTRRLTLMAMLTAASLIIFIVEAQLPPLLPIPGVKLGLANLITLTAMVMLGRREAGAILLCRIVLGSVFAGGVSALLFSIAGGLLSYLVMCLLKNAFPGKLLWVLSVFGAIAHNVGQLAVAVLISGTPKLALYYGPALLAAGILTGAFTGLAAMFLVKALSKLKKS